MRLPILLWLVAAAKAGVTRNKGHDITPSERTIAEEERREEYPLKRQSAVHELAFLLQEALSKGPQVKRDNDITPPEEKLEHDITPAQTRLPGKERREEYPLKRQSAVYELASLLQEALSKGSQVKRDNDITPPEERLDHGVTPAETRLSGKEKRFRPPLTRQNAVYDITPPEERLQA
ncbi:hypothetical protein GCK32_002104 [Trichostrongylus colubriformis]|uniref:Uncharacterized protein n=1 Tax=Trichostrongylus colubriformis TaxID=6319 RepID=A0AAN8IJ10_TRICO